MRLRQSVCHDGGVRGGVDSEYPSRNGCVGLFRQIYEYNGAGMPAVLGVLVFSDDSLGPADKLFREQTTEKYRLEKASRAKLAAYAARGAGGRLPAGSRGAPLFIE